jgi:hypothetical protein
MTVSKAKSTRTGGSARASRATGKAGRATALRSVAGIVSSTAPRGLLSGRTVAKLIERLSAVVEKSKPLGGPVSLKVDIDPKGVATFTLTSEAEVESAASSQGDLERALESARQRGRARVADILNGDDMLSADEFAALLGTSRVTVNTKRQNRQVLALEGAKRGFRFPDWQVGEDGKPFAILPKLFDRLGDNPWVVYRFLVQHHPELGGLTGRDALRRGKVAEVIEAAESVVRAFA